MSDVMKKVKQERQAKKFKMEQLQKWEASINNEGGAEGENANKTLRSESVSGKIIGLFFKGCLRCKLFS